MRVSSAKRALNISILIGFVFAIAACDAKGPGDTGLAMELVRSVENGHLPSDPSRFVSDGILQRASMDSELIAWRDHRAVAVVSRNLLADGSKQSHMLIIYNLAHYNPDFGSIFPEGTSIQLDNIVRVDIVDEHIVLVGEYGGTVCERRLPWPSKNRLPTVPYE